MGEMIKYGIKVALAIAAATTFIVAVTTICNLVVGVVGSSVVGEVFGIISNCLPFNLMAVISSIVTVNAAILSFMIASKIFNLIVKTNESTS